MNDWILAKIIQAEYRKAHIPAFMGRDATTGKFYPIEFNYAESLRWIFMEPEGTYRVWWKPIESKFIVDFDPVSE